MRHIAIALFLASCGPQIELSGHPAPPSPHPPERTTVPPIERTDRVTTDTPIDGIVIDAQPYAATGYRLRLVNETNGSASVLWDESTLVLSTGESAGRLIRGETRKMDVSNAQPPTPLPPRANIVQDVLAEKLISIEENEADIARRDSVSVEYRDALVAARKKRDSFLIGGRLIVTVQLPDGKRTWTGRIEGGE